MGWCVTMMFGTREVVDFFYWFLVMPGIVKNLGAAKLKREDLETEDEEFIEEPSRVARYTSYP